MKFSTTFTLAALMLMSSGTDARIGGGQRELHGHHSHEDYYYDDYDYDFHGHGKGVRCQDPSTYNPTYTPQCINVGSGGYTCQHVGRPETSEYRCVAPPPTAAPTSDEGVSCVDPSTYNPTYTPQCINVGSGGYTCENVRMGGVAEYRCVPPPPTAAPTSQQIIPCHTNHNPTTTPECPSGYTCQALRGQDPNHHDGHCQEDRPILHD